MLSWFFLALIALVVVELVKGLSANGTPPVLQKFSWQMDLAHFMWSKIKIFRTILAILIIYFAFKSLPVASVATVSGAVALGVLWGFIFWLFNYFWVGKYKFLPITQKVFQDANHSEIDKKLEILGVDINGKQKAYPVNMVYYHHQIADELAGQSIWVTYCGLCNSGRVYDIHVDGQALDFSLVGAITYNAVFRDRQTGSWWRQETGEAAKGPLKGKQLQDLAFEQMTLENWLAKHPNSEILQYDPTFLRMYNFLAKLMNYEVSKPGWHMQDTPAQIIGVEIEGNSKAYDWVQIQNRKLVQDDIGTVSVVIFTDTDATSAFVYDRTVEGQKLEFEVGENGFIDTKTGSTWDQFGHCLQGEMKDQKLKQIQSYKQFIRAWISFHPGTTFYDFT